MIEARGLVKQYGDTVAVGGLTFDVQPGLVTGFLGPNGSGKSTTLRMCRPSRRSSSTRPVTLGTRRVAGGSSMRPT
jgi:ABC-2 type transport system ATP-binding protein